MSQQLQPVIPLVIHPNVQPNFGGPSIRQLKFIDRYLETGNATESARYAGYLGDDNQLAVQGHSLLRLPKVRLEIQRRLGTSIASSGEVLETLTKHARGDVTDILDDNGSINLRLAKRKRLLKKLKIKTDKDGSVTHEYEIHDPQAALEKLGRFHKLFTDKIETESSLSESDIDRLGQSLLAAMLEAARRKQAALPAGDTPSSE